MHGWNIPHASAQNIAILGWGSLLWETQPEFDDWHNDWQMDGPVLKLEFSRVSISRARALTLVIDEEYGTPTMVAYCVSKRKDPEDAICDLRSREGTTKANIGYLFARDDRFSCQHNEALPTIRSWAYHKGFDIVVWTDLRRHFMEEAHQPFSVQAAVAHVKSLSAEGKIKAKEYIWRAPKFVDTPLRRALQGEAWFIPPSC